MGYKEDFIKFMVSSNVLTFGNFVTKSGRNTPYFINTGNYKTGEQISKLGDYYAACIKENISTKIDALYGPAYKGIPLAITTASALYRNYGLNIPYSFNRKEIKNHGEGGNIIGYMPKDGDNIVITEDVLTAGTALRENIPILKALADVNISTLIISVDRMECGKGDKTAIQEVRDELGINVIPIVTILDIIDCLHNQEIDGKIYIDDNMKEKIEAYLLKYGVN